MFTLRTAEFYNRVVHPRFFAPEAQTSGDLVTLPDEEAQHLTRVLRLGAGAAVRVFNGIGDEFESVVEAATKEAVQVRVGPPRDPAPEARFRVSLAQAVLKGDKMDDVVRDAVMMGATVIRPVLTARTETSAREESSAGAVGARRNFLRQAMWPRRDSTHSCAGNTRRLDTEPTGCMVGGACNHAGRTGRDEDCRLVF